MDRRKYATFLDVLCCTKDIGRHMRRIEDKLDILIGMGEVNYLENGEEMNEDTRINSSRLTE